MKYDAPTFVVVNRGNHRFEKINAALAAKSKGGVKLASETHAYYVPRRIMKVNPPSTVDVASCVANTDQIIHEREREREIGKYYRVAMRLIKNPFARRCN